LNGTDAESARNFYSSSVLHFINFTIGKLFGAFSKMGKKIAGLPHQGPKIDDDHVVFLNCGIQFVSGKGVSCIG
jgi:hypothetical protein